MEVMIILEGIYSTRQCKPVCGLVCCWEICRIIMQGTEAMCVMAFVFLAVEVVIFQCVVGFAKCQNVQVITVRHANSLSKMCCLSNQP